MARIKALSNTEADPKARPLLEAVGKKLGKTPNLMRTMANSPAVLEAYLGFSGALAKGALSARLREQIALVVGEANRCDYCLAAHSALGRLAGLKDDEIAGSRRGATGDAKIDAALAFARTVVVQRGVVSDEDLLALRSAGYGDGEIAEVVANVALNIFTNYFNHIAATEVDFPQAAKLEPAAACVCG
ncbi:MAG: alkyl hydroperoxide reductase AhpD [Planctomycetota bacterium]